MEIEIKTALIGVGATIAGTILGWLLNEFSNLGKLNIYTTSWKDEFSKNDAGEINPSKTKDEVECYSYRGTLDIYNSSAQTKIMRNIRVVFSDGEKELHKSIPFDDSTKRVIDYRIPAHYESIGVLNIQPKSVISISVHESFWENEYKKIYLDFLWKTKVVFIKYEDEKGKTKTFKIKNVDFIDFFSENKVEKI